MTSKIDRLGLLQAQAAPLLTKIETLKDEIAAELGVGSHEGQWYRVSVVDSQSDRRGVPSALYLCAASHRRLKPSRWSARAKGLSSRAYQSRE